MRGHIVVLENADRSIDLEHGQGYILNATDSMLAQRALQLVDRDVLVARPDAYVRDVYRDGNGAETPVVG